MLAHVKGGGSASFLSNAMVTRVRRSAKPWCRNQETDFFKALKRNESRQNEEKEESVSVIMLVVGGFFRLWGTERSAEHSGSSDGNAGALLNSNALLKNLWARHTQLFTVFPPTTEATLVMVLVPPPQIFCIIQIWLKSTYSWFLRTTRTCKCSLHVPTAADRLYHDRYQADSSLHLKHLFIAGEQAA